MSEGSEGKQVDSDAIGESRWPMAIATLGLMALSFVPPDLFKVGPVPIYPIVMGTLLAVLVVGDPGRVDRRARWLRWVLLALVALLVGGAIAGTFVLVVDLVQGSPQVAKAGPLLIYTAKVWLGNILAFGLLYWAMDQGGAAERVHGTRRYPDFVFPQMTDPALGGPEWRSRFIDYLYIGFTNANAFSPTDALPLTGRAKLAMETQSLISFAIITLALARVVSVFT